MKKYQKWITVGVIAFLAALGVVTGYFLQQQKVNKERSLIFIPKTEGGSNDFWTSLIAGAKMAAKEYNAELTVLAPRREQDVERQIKLLQQAVREQPDAILISPSSINYDEYLNTAREKGIKIVYIDSYAEGDYQELTVATDNLKMGRELGEFAKNLLNEESEIAIVSHMQGVSTAMEREQGFREGLGDLEKNVVDVVYCDSVYDKAYELTKELMEKYPDLTMIAGMNEYSSLGAARAVKAAGAKDRIDVVGVDSSLEAVQLMEQGVFEGLAVQKAFKMGYVGVRETLRALNGENVEKNVDSGCELVTPENMYDNEIEKLIFPFNYGKQTGDKNNSR